MRKLQAAFGVVVVATSIATVLAACGGDDDAESDPAAVLAAYEDARNAKDIDAVVAIYAADAVIIGHPLDDDGEADIEEIRSIEGGVVAIHESTKYTDVEVDGNTVTFTQEFTSTDGECFGGAGQMITVENGKIIEYVWGASGEPCEDEAALPSETAAEGGPIQTVVYTDSGCIYEGPADIDISDGPILGRLTFINETAGFGDLQTLRVIEGTYEQVVDYTDMANATLAERGVVVPPPPFAEISGRVSKVQAGEEVEVTVVYGATGITAFVCSEPDPTAFILSNPFNVIGTQQTGAGDDEITVEYLTGIWRDLGSGSFVQFNEDGTYRLILAIEDVENTTVDQGQFTLEGTLFTATSNEESRNCEAGQRGSYEIEVVGEDQMQWSIVEDECIVRSVSSTTFERVPQQAVESGGEES